MEFLAFVVYFIRLFKQRRQKNIKLLQCDCLEEQGQICETEDSASFREKRIAPGIPAPRGKIFSEQEANGPASAPPIPGWGGVGAIK